jgi:hypothetical protein
MIMVDTFEIPDEVTLLEFLGVEPVERSTMPHYWCYELTDDEGAHLRLSFDMLERSVQTIMKLRDQPLCLVVHEGATRMYVGDGKLRVEFNIRGAITKLEIGVGPHLSITWTSLT